MALPWIGVGLGLVGGYELSHGQAQGWWWLGAGVALLVADVAIDFVWAHPTISRSDQPDLNRPAAQLVGRVVVVAEAIDGGRGKVRVGDTLWPAEGPDVACRRGGPRDRGQGHRAGGGARLRPARSRCAPANECKPRSGLAFGSFVICRRTAPPAPSAATSAGRSGAARCALWTALATAASGGTIGTSPTPRMPCGCFSFGTSIITGSIIGRSRGDGHAVVEEARVIELAVGVVDAFLVQGPADALRGAALDLALHVARMDRPADVLERGVADHLDVARLRVDLHVADVGAEAGPRAFGVERGAGADRAARRARLGGELLPASAAGSRRRWRWPDAPRRSPR